MEVVNYVLRHIDSDKHLSPQMKEDPALERMVRSYNTLALRGSMHNVATGETYGAEFKKYVGFLPAHDVMKLLSTYLEDRELIGADKKVVSDTLATTAVQLITKVLAEDGEEDKKEDSGEAKEISTIAELEDRRLKHWLVKVVVVSSLIFVGVLVGGGTAIMWHNKVMPDNALVNTFMTSIGDVLKLLFNSK